MERAWWLARDARQRGEHDCGHPREVCGDPERTWFPQLSVCHVRQEQAAAQWRYGQVREAHGEFHDGSRRSWVKERSRSHPYHYMDGATVWVAETDLGLGGDFLSASLDGVEEVERGEAED